MSEMAAPAQKVQVPEAAMKLAEMLLGLSPSERVSMLWRFADYLMDHGELEKAGGWATLAMECRRNGGMFA